jgi:hypothetical protein
MADMSKFAPEGISRTADEICGLVKSGIVSGLSIGFEPIESEPIDRGNRYGPQRVVRRELMEISFVSIPANRETIVTQRSKRRRGRAWYLGPPGQCTDLGHRLNAREALRRGQCARRSPIRCALDRAPGG